MEILLPGPGNPMRIFELGTADIRFPAAERSNGVHLSGIVRAVMLAMGKQWPEEKTHDSMCRMALGLAWEHYYAAHCADSRWHHQPGEFEFEGVYFNPDLVDWERRVVGEVKTTSKRPPLDVHTQTHWLLQLQGYLWAIGQGEWIDAELHVLHIQYPQQARVYGLRFEPEELANTWQMLMKYRDRAIPEEH